MPTVINAAMCIVQDELDRVLYIYIMYIQYVQYRQYIRFTLVICNFTAVDDKLDFHSWQCCYKVLFLQLFKSVFFV